MYLHPLDRFSTSALSERGNLNLFSLSSTLSSSGVIQNLLVDNLINKKTSIVLVPSLEQAQYIQRCLEQANLASLSMIVTDDREINDKDLATLRNVAKSTITDQRTADFDLLRSSLEQAHADLSHSYGLLNKKIFGERTWRTLSAQKEHFHFHNEVNLVKRKINLEKINFTQKEYWNIRGRVEEASNTYVSKFSILQKVDRLAPSLYKADRLDSKVIKLEKLLNKGNNLLMSFAALIEQLHNELKQQGLDELEQLSAMNAAVSHSLMRYSKKQKTKGDKSSLQGKLKSVFSTKNEPSDLTALNQQVKFMCEEFEESKYFDLAIPSNDRNDLTLEQIKEITRQADTVLGKWQHIISAYSNTKLKQMSPLNSENPDLKKIDEALAEYLNEINVAEILDERLEDNTFSLYKKLDLLEITLEKMRTSFAILTENEDYVEWKSMLAYCKEATAEIIDALMGLPTNYWTRIFDQIFIGDLLDRNLSPRLPKNELQLRHIDELTSNYRSLISHTVKAKWNIEKENKLGELKKSDKQLYNTLVKKNNNLDISWPKMISKSPEVVMSMFPILIVTEAAITNIKPLYYKWSECISYKWTQLKSAGSLQLRGLSLKQTILEEANVTDDQKKRLNAYFRTDNINGITIEGDKLGNVARAFSQMDNIEKLSKARSLSKILLEVNPNLRLFYLRNNSLISTLTDRENSRIVEQLSDTGIKEVGSAHGIEETMVDMFVDHTKQCVILTEDGLLNTADIEFFDWQYHIIKNIKTLGCKIVDMWTADMEVSQVNLIRALNKKTTDKSELVSVEV